jgi:hypothetical protein
MSFARTPAERLLGRWRLMRADPTLEFAAGVRMEFLPAGHLVYTIPIENREMVVELIYRVDGNTLMTDNPLAPHATSTRMEFGPGDVLVLDFAGPRAWFVREL